LLLNDEEKIEIYKERKGKKNQTRTVRAAQQSVRSKLEFDYLQGKRESEYWKNRERGE
jgi:hypothetical protein